MEDELSECGSQPSSQIQMVAPIQLVPSSANQMSLTTASTEQIIHHQAAPHLLPATGAAIMPTESNIASNTTPIQHQIQQQQSLTEGKFNDYCYSNSIIISPKEIRNILEEYDYFTRITDTIPFAFQNYFCLNLIYCF